MYSISADEIRGLFEDYVEGSESGAVVALSDGPLPASARNALEKSLEAFGYGAEALAFATVLPRTGGEAGSARLDPQALFLLIEGIDPVCLVACDRQAAAALAATYRTACNRNAAQRIFGRPCVIFDDLPALLQSDAGKQRAWSLLKTLPRIV